MHPKRRLTQPLVASWFDLQPPTHQDTLRALHAIVTDEAPQLDLAIRSGNLVYIADHVHVLALAPFRAHVHLQLFGPAALDGHFPGLEGSVKGQRHLRLRYGQPFDEALVRAIARAAVASIGTGKPTEGGT